PTPLMTPTSRRCRCPIWASSRLRDLLRAGATVAKWPPWGNRPFALFRWSDGLGSLARGVEQRARGLGVVDGPSLADQGQGLARFLQASTGLRPTPGRRLGALHRLRGLGDLLIGVGRRPV